MSLEPRPGVPSAAVLPVGKTGPGLLPVGKTAPNRRQVLGALGAGLGSALGSALGGGLLAALAAGRRETLHCPFRDRSGAPQTLSVNALSWLFRDWRDDDQGLGIDIRLFDLLATVQTMMSLVEGRAVEISLTSGYRTPERNRTIEGAVPNSQHIRGRAADIVLPGVPHARVADAAEIAGAPGLGRYPGFTHLDVGPPGRRWQG